MAYTLICDEHFLHECEWIYCDADLRLCLRTYESRGSHWNGKRAFLSSGAVSIGLIMESIYVPDKSVDIDFWSMDYIACKHCKNQHSD